MPASVHISPHERRWLVGAALLVLALASLPYLIGALAAGPDRVFTGLQVNPLDGVSYLAKMRLGYDDGWLFRLLFTPEQGQGVFLFTYFIALGHLARIFSLPLIVMFHVARLLGGFALLWMIYELIARVTDSIDLRRRAWWVVALSSGVGWLAVLLGHADSADLTIPESNTFFSLMANAHFALAAAIMIEMFILILGMRSFSTWTGGGFDDRIAGPGDHSAVRAVCGVQHCGGDAIVIMVARSTFPTVHRFWVQLSPV